MAVNRVEEYRNASVAFEFADLEPFADWAGRNRNAYFSGCWLPCRAFYDLAFPRLADVMDYGDQFDLRDLPEDVRKLVHLMQSLIMVSFPVRVWKQPRVPDSGAAWARWSTNLSSEVPQSEGHRPDAHLSRPPA